MCSPKHEGGMGFRDRVLFKKALLAKQGWRLIMKQPESLVARLMRAKYYPHSSFIQAEERSDNSFVWRVLCVIVRFWREVLHLLLAMGRISQFGI